MNVQGIMGAQNWVVGGIKKSFLGKGPENIQILLVSLFPAALVL